MSHRIHRLLASAHRLAAPFVLSAFATLAGCDPPKKPPAVTTAAHTADVPPPDAAPKSIEERARELSQSLIIVDGHIDLPFRLSRGRGEDGKLSEDVRTRTEKGDFDFVRAREGGLDAPFMSIYVPASYQKKGGAKAFAIELIDTVEKIAEEAPEKFTVAHSVSDVRAAHGKQIVALPMGIENGAALEGKVENVKYFHGRGVRYITLTHSEDNAICDSSYADTHQHKGLSKLGEEIVAEMNRVGIMVDVSHISDDAFWRVMEVVKVPPIASHSSCRHFTPGFERNMSDDMIKRLAKAGGVVMINYGSTFLTKEARQWSDDMTEKRDAWMKKEGVKEKWGKESQAWIANHRKENPFPYATVADVADHIMHVVKLAGVEHVGLGSDFDGVGDSLPTGLKDPSDLPNLIAELLRRGVSEADVAKICGLNVMRVWAQVERAAAGG